MLCAIKLGIIFALIGAMECTITKVFTYQSVIIGIVKTKVDTH